MAALHSEILKNGLFNDFHLHWPDKLTNVTNGVTPRRWLLQANPPLSALITEAIGPGWVTDLERLRELVPLAEDSEFRMRWARAKLDNKKRFARYVLRKVNMGVNPKTMFDVQVKRMHEYKRQLLNVMHVVAQYNRIREDPGAHHTPRTVFFGGKAAPGYQQAKLIIRLINAVADTVNSDPGSGPAARGVFCPTTASPRPRRSSGRRPLGADIHGGHGGLGHGQ